MESQINTINDERSDISSSIIEDEAIALNDLETSHFDKKSD